MKNEDYHTFYYDNLFLINDENQVLRFLLMITLFRQFPKHIYILVIYIILLVKNILELKL